MSTLKLVRRSMGAKRADVIFIHGLKGNATTCWTASNNVYWPVLLFKHFPTIDVWVYDYEADASTWHGGHAMFIEDRAINLLKMLSAKGIGSNKLIFVSHSYGGLLVKQLLLQATYEEANEAIRNILENTCGIIFLGTPHEGHLWADKAILWSWIVPFTPILDELRANNEKIEQLHVAFFEVKKRFDFLCQSIYETKKVTDLRGKGFIVPKIKAEGIILCFDEFVSCDCDHFEISKPKSDEAEIFVFTISFIVKALDYGEAKSSPYSLRKIKRAAWLAEKLPDVINPEVLNSIIVHIVEEEINKEKLKK